MFEARYSRTFQTIFLFLIPAVLCSLAYSKVIYVDDDAAGANDGSKWENAYVYLQDALAGANSAEKPVEIRVAQGIYKPDQSANHTPGDRQATFQLINSVILKGGYAGFGEPDPNARDVELYETVLSGDLNGNDNEVTDTEILHDTNRYDNSYHVVTGSGTDSTSVLDGFMIRGGSTYRSELMGGGMYNKSGSPTVVNCTFSGNEAVAEMFGGWIAGKGGGMYNDNNSNPTLTNCKFTGNSASQGGGGMYNVSSSPLLTNCTFSENTTDMSLGPEPSSGGGGMYNEQNSNPTLTDCTFNDNSGNNGSAMYSANSAPTLTNCTFSGNEAVGEATLGKGNGGGMFNWESSPTLTDCTFNDNYGNNGGAMFNGRSSPILTNCIFSGNTADDFGGGMSNSRSSPTLTDCTFSGNTAKWAGGGMSNSRSSPTLTDCTFRGNTSELNGGGMRNFSNSSPTLTNCMFSGNTAVWGGGMYNECNSSPTLTNCTFSGNTAEGSGGGMHNGGWTYKENNSNPTLTDCTFSGNTAEYQNGGGVFSVGIASLTLANCTFSANEAQNGGGMYNSTAILILTDCTFSGNKAVVVEDMFGGWNGGGMYNVVTDSLILANCTFSGNTAERDGGGMYNDGTVSLRITITNCIFGGNTAESGGGVYNRSDVELSRGTYYRSMAEVINCTFSSNSAATGGGIRNYSGSVTLTNCILSGGGDDVWNNQDASMIINYSDIQASIYDPGLVVIWGEGNIDVDPDFVRPGYWTQPSPRNPNSSVWIEGDYHLKSEAGRWDPVSESWITDNLTSLCIDAGDPNMPVGDEPDPNGGRINMGAYGGTAEASKSPGYSWWFETTQGPVLAEGLGIVLPHEHIFTDLRGPTTPGYGQADAADVVRVMAPLLTDAREKGVGVMFECSSIGVGRNVSIIAQVAEVSGLPVVVPTGVYGRANFAPPEHRNMTEDELKTLFISEIRDGIEDTGIKAGFIKIATDDGPMNALIEKILRAAGRAASETGAAIASHTPVGSNAVRQVDILDSIDPAIKFIWVHAQNEGNRSLHLQLAARGAYIEFDSLGWNPAQDSMYIAAIKNLLAAGHGDRILLSHDAGWYRPGQANGGTQKPYTYLIDAFFRKLRSAGVDDATIRMITQTNPVRAFGFKSDE